VGKSEEGKGNLTGEKGLKNGRGEEREDMGSTAVGVRVGGGC
jgi:hypothetical protein